MHLVEQWLQEVLVLQDTDRRGVNLPIQDVATNVSANECVRGRGTHCEFLDLSGEGRMESHMLKQGGSEPHT